MNGSTALALRDILKRDDADAVLEAAIVRFLGGESDGHELFQALYGPIADEPIPDRMLALVRSAC